MLENLTIIHSFISIVLIMHHDNIFQFDVNSIILFETLQINKLEHISNSILILYFY
jgi:hypothetical protein